MRNLRRKFAPRPNIVLASFKFYPPPRPLFYTQIHLILHLYGVNRKTSANL